MKTRRLVINKSNFKGQYSKIISKKDYDYLTNRIKYIKNIYDLLLLYSITSQSISELLKTLKERYGNSFQAFKNINLRVISACASVESFFELMQKHNNKFNYKNAYSSDIELYILKKLRNYVVHSNFGVVAYKFNNLKYSIIDLNKVLTGNVLPNYKKFLLNLKNEQKQISLETLFIYIDDYCFSLFKSFLVGQQSEFIDIYERFLGYIDDYHLCPRCAWINNMHNGDNLCTALCLLFAYINDANIRNDEELIKISKSLEEKVKFVELMKNSLKAKPDN